MGSCVGRGGVVFVSAQIVQFASCVQSLGVLFWLAKALQRKKQKGFLALLVSQISKALVSI